MVEWLIWLCGNSGTRLHEGIDILSIKRDENRSLLILFARRRLVASFISITTRLHHDYGKYVVVAHEGGFRLPLYAHLRSVHAEQDQQDVGGGDELGVLGHTTNYSEGIASWRAHLHFEIGLQINSRFNGWFKHWYRDGNNLHGPWNGLNLLGLDAAEILRRSCRTV